MRLRGRTDLGTTFMQVLCRYGAALTDAGSKLVLVSASEQIHDQLRAAGVTDVIGFQDIYAGDERLGATFQRAYADAIAWIQANQRRAGTGTPATPGRPEAAAACEPGEQPARRPGIGAYAVRFHPCGIMRGRAGWNSLEAEGDSHVGT